MTEGMEREINRLVDNILDDYERSAPADQGNTVNRLDKSAIIEIVHKLQQIIFPGYFKNNKYRVYTAKNNLSMLLEDVLFNLSRQVEIVLESMAEYAGRSREELERMAAERCVAFLERIPAVRQLIGTDVQAAYDGDPAAYNTEEIIFSYPGLYAIMVNRLAHELHLLGVSLIPRIMTEYAHGATGIDIHPGATIGKYFFIDHGTGIVIGETTIIGDHVKVYQGVTLGALSTKGGQKLKSKKRHPTIEDNVTIYSGASILGGETVIGAGAVIGGNAFITTSIPAGTRVSIKNQELRYESGGAKFHSMELVQDDTWYYMI
ncbi:MAG: serine acetyltransferase [Lachnospiraceae bacterium]|nr:serine acetyltransferase [Lachnospiraceae bacterium]